MNNAQKQAYQAAYYQANKEKEAARMRAYQQANKEKGAARTRAYREANKEKEAARERAYYQAKRHEKIVAALGRVPTDDRGIKLTGPRLKKTYRRLFGRKLPKRLKSVKVIAPGDLRV